MSRRVPFKDTAKGLISLVKDIARELESATTFHATATAYKFAKARPNVPVDTGKARWGLNPSAGRPMALDHPDGTYPEPGDERMLALREAFGSGIHGFLSFHAHDAAGVFDYAGIKLEAGWSAQAPFGVLGPTQRHVESSGALISGLAVADTDRKVA